MKRIMREIKFLSWDEKNQILIGPWEIGSELSIQATPDYQYTGKHDKNGNEIYEGHLFRNKNNDLLMITWDSDNLLYCFVKWKDGQWTEACYDPFVCMEIIGHIKTHKELLNEYKKLIPVNTSFRILPKYCRKFIDKQFKTFLTALFYGFHNHKTGFRVFHQFVYEWYEPNNIELAKIGNIKDLQETIYSLECINQL